MDDARTLILMRHAKSDWSGGEPDHDRPLAARGRRQAPEAGRWLAVHVDRIDLAVVSSAERARSTWSLASSELTVAPPVRIDEAAYGASGHALLRLVRELPDDLTTVVLVGHNPGLEDLVSAMTGAWVAMPTSALALVTVSGPWAGAGPTSARLEASGRPPQPR